MCNICSFTGNTRARSSSTQPNSTIIIIIVVMIIIILLMLSTYISVEYVEKMRAILQANGPHLHPPYYIIWTMQHKQACLILLLLFYHPDDDEGNDNGHHGSFIPHKDRVSDSHKTHTHTFSIVCSFSRRKSITICTVVNGTCVRQITFCA